MLLGDDYRRLNPDKYKSNKKRIYTSKVNKYKFLIDEINLQFLLLIRKDMLILHDNEIIDMIDDDIAKISKQCISNYSMYLSLITKKT